MLEKNLPPRDLEANAKELDIASVHTLRAYRSGTRIPPPATARKLAAKLFENPKQRDDFLTAVESASPQRSQLESLSSHHINLRVSTIEFSAVSRLLPQPNGDPPHGYDSSDLSTGAAVRRNPTPGFVDTVFLRFLRLSGMGWDSHARNFSADVREQLWNGSVDLALSYFTSIDRALLVRFWTLPIRLTLGALCHSSFQSSEKPIKEVRAALYYRTAGLPRTDIFPIVLNGSVAHNHCRATLGYVEGQTMWIVERRDFKLYDETYQAAREQFPEKIPVLVDDELTLAEMLSATAQDGTFLFPDYFPALPLTSQNAASGDSLKRESPIYFVSIACSRNNEKLWQFLDDALRTLLLSEIFTTSQAYADLYFELLDTLRRALPRYPVVGDRPLPQDRISREAEIFAAAHQWVMHALHLTSFAIAQFTEAYPHWKSILTHARELVFKRLAGGHDPNSADVHSGADDIADLVYRRKPAGPLREAEIDDTIRRIEEDLDIDLRLARWARRYAALSPNGLRKIVLQRLSGDMRDPTVELCFGVYRSEKPMEAPLIAKARQFLENHAESGVGAFDERDETARVRDAIADPMAFLAASGGRCLIATWADEKVPESMRDILGVAFMAPVPGQPRAQELQYLWVDLKYRGMGIGGRLIDYAVCEAKSIQAASLTIRIHASAAESVLRYFRANGFESSRSPGQSHKEMVRFVDVV